jgi:hypothetical protein
VASSSSRTCVSTTIKTTQAMTNIPCSIVTSMLNGLPQMDHTCTDHSTTGIAAQGHALTNAARVTRMGFGYPRPIKSTPPGLWHVIAGYGRPIFSLSHEIHRTRRPINKLTRRNNSTSVRITRNRRIVRH